MFTSKMPINQATKDHLYALIFCGGGGTRLWPLSRDNRPKQFLKIGSKSKSLLQQTYERIAPIIPNERIFLISLPDYTDEISQQLPGIPPQQIISEPLRRNTAMAAGLGVITIKQKDPQAIIANIWSDQLIQDARKYQNTLLAAAQMAANSDQIVTTGVKPKYPHIGLGYAKKSQSTAQVNGINVYKVQLFKEKPKLAQAKTMFKSGNYLWHIGLYVWKVDTFLASLKLHSPAMFKALQAIESSFDKPNYKSILLGHYKDAEKIPIELAVAEKASNFLIVEGTFNWIDIGDFNSVWEISNKDKFGNAVIHQDEGEWIGMETRDSMIINSGKRILATYGISDMIVVSTDDAVLIIPKSMAQSVKPIVEFLKQQNKKEYL